MQVITQSKTRLAADNLELYRKTNDLDYRETNDLNYRETNDLNYRKTNDLNFRETKSSTLNKSESNDLNVVKNKSSILSLIKEAQEFDLLCKQISSQLCRKLKRNFSFTLIKNEILRKMNHVFMF